MFVIYECYEKAIDNSIKVFTAITSLRWIWIENTRKN